MNNEEDQFTSLSLLDVVTNGLGGVLLLFFLMVAIQGKVLILSATEDASAKAAAARGEVPPAPFVILVRGDPGQELLHDRAAVSWKIHNAPADYQPRFSQGANFAFLLAARPPPAETLLWLGNLPVQCEHVYLEIFHGERRVFPLPGRAVARVALAGLEKSPDGQVRLWPPPATEGP